MAPWTAASEQFMLAGGFADRSPRAAKDFMVGDRNSRGGATGRGWSDAQRAAVIKETNRILAHPTFKSSNRCVALLGFLVDHALSGNEEGTKERTLGTEVFGRIATYDTNADPIVRRTANEIRKRLAQCYLESDGHHGVKIQLQRGSYVPEFEFDEDGNAQENSEKGPELSQSADPGVVRSGAGVGFARNALSSKRVLGVSAVLLVVVFCVLALRSGSLRSPEYKVWKPMLNSRAPVNVCLSDLGSVIADGTGQTGSQPNNKGSGKSPVAPAVDLTRFSSDTPFTDANVAHKISSWLSEHKIATNLRPCSALKLQDFSEAPTVLVGGTNNPWALILLSKLSNARFSIRTNPNTKEKWVEDAQNPSNRDWKIDGETHDNDVSVDYAVITRFFDKDSGQWVMALSGLQAHGTEAAGELLTNPAFVKLLPSSLSTTGNFQLVLRTSVVRGSTGPMKVLAAYKW